MFRSVVATAGQSALAAWNVYTIKHAALTPASLAPVQLDPTAGGPPPPADLGTIAARVAAGSATGWGAAAPYSAPAEVLADVWALWEHCRASPRMNDSMLCVPPAVLEPCPLNPSTGRGVGAVGALPHQPPHE